MGWLAPHGEFGGAFSAAREAVSLPGLASWSAVGLLAAWPLRWAGLANPWMLGPCAVALVLAATGKLPSGVPAPLVDAAQVAMGASLGTRLTRSFLVASRRLAIVSAVSAALLSLLLTLLAVPIALLSGLPLPAMILGLAPGGMLEMSLTAQALELAVPLVLAFHLLRTVLCNLLVGPLHRWWCASAWSADDGYRAASGGERRRFLASIQGWFAKNSSRGNMSVRAGGRRGVSGVQTCGGSLTRSARERMPGLPRRACASTSGESRRCSNRAWSKGIGRSLPTSTWKGQSSSVWGNTAAKVSTTRAVGAHCT